MRHATLLPLVLLPLFVVGCATLGVGSASAGQDIDYYLKTHEVPERIATAMRERRIVKGMSKTQVRLVIAEVTGSDEPSSSGEQGDVWQFENDGEILQIAFDENDRVTNVHRIG